MFCVCVFTTLLVSHCSFLTSKRLEKSQQCHHCGMLIQVDDLVYLAIMQTVKNGDRFAIKHYNKLHAH